MTVKLGTLDGGNTAQTAKRLGTFRGSASRVFGGFFSDNERVEWFQFRTAGSRFNRSSLTFSALAKATKVEVFFQSDSGEESQSLGQLTLSGRIRRFKVKPEGAGTYQIKIVPLGIIPPAYAVGFTISGSGRQTSAAPASTDRDPRSLFS